MVKRPRFFYGWLIVATGVISMTLVYGTRHSFSVFFAPILDEFGWSRGDTAFMLSLNLLIYGLTAPVAGSLADRWKPRRVMMMGALVLALATVGCAFARELWHFYLLFGIMTPVGTAFCGWPLVSPTLANWFVKRRGLAMGLGQMGGGLSFTYAMFADFVISQSGWRNAYLIIAGIILVVLLPLYLFLFHYRPEDKGLTAYGPVEGSLSETTDVNKPVYRDWTLGQAVRTYQLWFLALSAFLYWGLGSYMVFAHQVKFALDAGYSSAFAASIFALLGILTAAGQFSTALSDWIGREKTFTLAVLLSIGALIALVSVKDTSQSWLLYVYAICFGYGAGFCSVLIFVGAADIFYGKHFGAISGILLTGMGIGGVIGPWLGGYMYDIWGSYTGAFVLCMVCLGLACIAFWIAAPRKAARLRVRTQSLL